MLYDPGAAPLAMKMVNKSTPVSVVFPPIEPGPKPKKELKVTSAKPLVAVLLKVTLSFPRNYL